MFYPFIEDNYRVQPNLHDILILKNKTIFLNSKLIQNKKL